MQARGRSAQLLHKSVSEILTATSVIVNAAKPSSFNTTIAFTIIAAIANYIAPLNRLCP